MTSTPSAKQSHTGIVQKTRQSLPPPFPRSLASAATGDGQQRLFLPPPRPTLTPGTVKIPSLVGSARSVMTDPNNVRLTPGLLGANYDDVNIFESSFQPFNAASSSSGGGGSTTSSTSSMRSHIDHSYQQNTDANQSSSSSMQQQYNSSSSSAHPSSSSSSFVPVGQAFPQQYQHHIHQHSHSQQSQQHHHPHSQQSQQHHHPHSQQSQQHHQQQQQHQVQQRHQHQNDFASHNASTSNDSSENSSGVKQYYHHNPNQPLNIFMQKSNTHLNHHYQEHQSHQDSPSTLDDTQTETADGTPNPTSCRNNVSDPSSSRPGRGQTSTQRAAPVESDRKLRSLERNRVAAHKCRQKKREWVHELEVKTEHASQRHEQLQASISQLKDELIALKTMLLAHRNCNCDLVQKYLHQGGLMTSSMAGGPQPGFNGGRLSSMGYGGPLRHA